MSQGLDNLILILRIECRENCLPTNHNKLNNLVKIRLFKTILFMLLIGCQNPPEHVNQVQEDDEFITPIGKTYSLAEPSGKMISQYDQAKKEFESAPENVENIIWFGRRTAYLGRYEEAINIYTDGLKLFPDEARLYRHRGHRYISLRKFDAAIKDLEIAGGLIAGSENEVEPDGMPNALNIPVSTLHGNIWYHLGLAHYLNHDYENALQAYIKCRNSGSNPDNIVSSTHWLYMIQKRLGNDELAVEMLAPIELGTAIIENESYYNLCKFYKGLIPLDSLLGNDEDSPASDAVKYGLANWYFYNDDKETSRKHFDKMVAGDSWTSFGYIAAESDLIKYFDYSTLLLEQE